MNLNLCQKILPAEKIQELDQLTIQDEPIASIDLMERASECFVELFVARYSTEQPVWIFCGTRNNGGDGMAIARLLMESDYQVETAVIGDPDKGSKDFQINYRLLSAFAKPLLLKDTADFPELEVDTVVIDAIFGSGLSRGVGGLHGNLITHINQSGQEVVAVDIASGLGCEQKFEEGAIARVNRTIAFQLPKFSQLLPENHAHVGELHIVDIGLHQKHLDEMASERFMVTLPFVQSLIKKRSKYAHKGTAGHCLLVAGSEGKMGAAILAARSCLRAGAGLLSCYVPAAANDILQISVPEAMVISSTSTHSIADIPELKGYVAVGIGPGLGTNSETKEALAALLKKSVVPLVLDADALNMLSLNPALFHQLPDGSVLTPHPGEFRRMVGDWKDDYERHQKQLAFSKEHRVIVLLKGAHTCITTPEGLSFFNSTGNPGMATGGSGDVLTGIITALLGQGYSAAEAAILACYVHGLAGDLFLKDGAPESLIASDIIEHLPGAFKILHV